MMRVLKTAAFLTVVVVNVLVLSSLLVPRTAPAAGEPTTASSGDTDGNGRLQVTDAIRILRYLFDDGPAPLPVACAEEEASCCPEIIASLDALRAALEPECFEDFGRFDNQGDGTVVDHCLGLDWTATSVGTEVDGAGQPVGSYTLPEALEIAATATIGGHEDWRLPTADEWETFLRYRSARRLDRDFIAAEFDELSDHRTAFWTSSEAAGEALVCYLDEAIIVSSSGWGDDFSLRAFLVRER